MGFLDPEIADPGYLNMGVKPITRPSAWQGLLGQLGGNPGLLNLGMSIMANNTGGRKRSLGEIVGKSYMQSQMMAQEQAAEKMRQDYMRAQMEQMKKPGPVRTAVIADPMTGQPKIVKEEESVGQSPYMEQSSPASGPRMGVVNPDSYTPESVAAYQSTINPTTGYGDFRLLKPRYAPPAVSIGNIAGVPNILDPGNRLGNGVTTPLSNLNAEAEAAARKAAEEVAARTRSGKTAERQESFNADIARISDEISRTTRLLNEFKAGKYQTGPMAGKLPNWRTAAQDLSRETGKDVISAISSATFGSLSEGERAFLRELGVNANVNEESNINYLNQRLGALIMAKNRLLKQNQEDNAQAAPQSGGNLTFDARGNRK